jgi:sugar/nucleoside kinase (ribokinase family)
MSRYLRPLGSAEGKRVEVQLKELRDAAKALKLTVEEIETQPDPKGLESAFKTAKQKQVNAIMTTSNSPFFAERKRIVELLPSTDCLLFTSRRSL